MLLNNSFHYFSLVSGTNLIFVKWSSKWMFFRNKKTVCERRHFRTVPKYWLWITKFCETTKHHIVGNICKRSEQTTSKMLKTEKSNSHVIEELQNTNIHRCSKMCLHKTKSGKLQKLPNTHSIGLETTTYLKWSISELAQNYTFSILPLLSKSLFYNFLSAELRNFIVWFFSFQWIWVNLSRFESIWADLS